MYKSALNFKKPNKKGFIMNKYISLLSLLLITIITGCKDKKDEYKPISADSHDEIFASVKQIPDGDFLGDQSCVSCHENAFKDWKGSDHDKAMQIATDTTVLANFNDAIFKSQGITSTFSKKNGEFYVNTEGPDGEYDDYKVEYTFGIKPLQQYIVKFPDGRFQCLRTAWDTEKNKWFDLYPDFKVVHSEWIHWTKGGLNWNTMCADCHSTNVRKNYDETKNSFNTEYSLINVSCEACHGPGKNHVAQVKKLGENYKPAEDIKMTSDTPQKLLIDECARCHMLREQVTESYNFEGTLLDHYFPQLLIEERYHVDGQILEEDYVYGSFLQSKMYHNNVSCTDCHNPHSTKLKLEGNNLCLQCHTPETYNVETHNKHKINTEGAQCINCHMPGRIYMGNDYRRDHSFRIPRPDLSIKYDTPNACIQCHTDKDNQWALKNYIAYYGEPKKNHFSDLLAPGLSREENGAHNLMTLAKDTSYPNIARASAVKGLSNYPNANDINELISFLNDDSPLVQAATLDVLKDVNKADYLNYFYPLLKSKERTLRIKAFVALNRLDVSQVPEEYKDVYSKVEKEFETSLEVIADFPGGKMKKADYYQRQGDNNKAIKYTEEALKLDPVNNNIRTNLASLYYNNGELQKAESAYKTILEQEPEHGETYYSYALLLAELNKINAAITQMENAIKYMPENIRVYYNLALLYDRTGNFKNAESTAKKGLKIAPENESLLYVISYLYAKNNQLRSAAITANKLITLYPNNQQYINLYNQINANLQQ